MKKDIEEKEEQDPDLRPGKLTWVTDTVGRQGVALFDGKKYWITRFDDSGKAHNVPLSQAEWDNRTSEMTERKKKKSRQE